MTSQVRGDKLRCRATRGYRVCGSQLEMRHARQRDELGVAVWLIQRSSCCICILALLCLENIYIYCHYSSTELHLPAGSLFMWTKLPARYTYTSMDIVVTVHKCCRYLTYMYVSDIHILQLFVYSTPLACWECDCVDEVACSIYIYACRCCL